MDRNKKSLKYKAAVGLEYKGEGDNAPSISVKGDALIADEIVRLAKRFGIPIVENPELAKALVEIDTEDEIPVELYEAVAIVLAGIEKR